MAKNNVLVNGLSAVTSGSGGMLMTAPDVCKTTVGPSVVPIPYPNIAESKDLDKGSTSVMIEGNPVCLQSSTLSKSTGDEAGNLKGIISSAGQGEAKPLSFSPTVFIEGKAIVRNTDLFTSNKMNTPPAPIMQSQVAPAIAPPIKDVKIDIKCLHCGKERNINCSMNKKVKDSDGDHDRDEALYKKQIVDKYKGYPKTHPWYAGDNSIQIHHVIDIKAVEDLGKEFKQFNYNINHAHNLIVLPSKMATACKLGVPLHSGKHSLGRAIGINKEDENVRELETIEESKDYKAVVEEEESYDTYPEATKEEIEDIVKLLKKGAFCYDKDGNAVSTEETQKRFIKQMNIISNKILKRISDFVWTINRDGRDYRPGNPCGCSGVDYMDDKLMVRGKACDNKQHGRSTNSIKITTLKIGH